MGLLGLLQFAVKYSVNVLAWYALSCLKKYSSIVAKFDSLLNKWVSFYLLLNFPYDVFR